MWGWTTFVVTFMFRFYVSVLRTILVLCAVVLQFHQNWDTLRNGPAPYKPDSADEMSALLEDVKHVAASSPEMPKLVKRITANFDDFQEVRAYMTRRILAHLEAQRYEHAGNSR